MFAATTASANLLSQVGIVPRVALGAAGGAALFYRHGPREASSSERLALGGSLGVAAGALAPAAVVASGYGIRASGRAGMLAASGLGSYFRSMPQRFSQLRSKGASLPSAVYKAYGRTGMFALAGALAGASISDDNRTTGAVIGAGVGLATKGVIAGTRGYSKLSSIPFGRTAAVLATSALLFAGVRGMQDHVEEYQPRARDLIGAEGDLVFGLNNRRHG